MRTIHIHLRKHFFHAPLPEAAKDSLSDLFHSGAPGSCTESAAVLLRIRTAKQHFHGPNRQRCILHLVTCNGMQSKTNIIIILRAQGKINVFLPKSKESIVLFRHRYLWGTKF